MTSINTKISELLNSGSTIPYDQVEVEAVMKKLLYEHGITDVMYPGSNISMLTSVVSYVISTLNINTAINLQETLLPLATKRLNVLFGARQLGYEPHQKRSYIYKIRLLPMYDDTKLIPADPNDPNSELIVDKFNKEPRLVPLLRNTRFVANGKTYYYFGEDIPDFFSVSNYEISNNLPAAQPKEIFIKEGILKSWETIDGIPGDPTLEMVVRSYTNEQGIVEPEQEFIIPFRDVEEDGLQVFVETPDYSTAWTGQTNIKRIEKRRLHSFLIDTSFNQEKDTFIRMENLILQYPAIFFQYNGLGTPVKSGDRILVNALISSGADGKLEGDIEVDGVTASQLFKVDLTYGAVEIQKGTDVESVKSIKENAAIFNNSANRAVTKNDWVSITKSFPMVKEGTAWGGEEEYNTAIPENDINYKEPLLGHVFVSCVPYFDEEYTHTPKIPRTDDGQGNITPEKMEKWESNLFTTPIDTTPVNADEKHNWFLSNRDIYGNTDPAGPPPVYDNTKAPTDYLINYLNYYKIITMEVHHRHPVYFNFSYIVDVVKYDLSNSQYAINKRVFDTIDEYFQDQMNKYDVDYIHSNLQRIVDQTLTLQSGLSLSVRVQACLFKGMMDIFTGSMFIDLAFPYEDMWVNSDHDNSGLAKGELKTWLLPRIDTKEFGVNKGTITVNYDDPNLKSLTLGSGVQASTDIIYTDPQGTQNKIGVYTINKKTKAIELVFFEKISTTLIDEIFGTDATNTRGEFAYLDIVYPFSDTDDDDKDVNNNSTYKIMHNIPFKKNSFPRLQKVEFKDN